jgi:hypothetical protein
VNHEFINHLMLCKVCFAPANRYCEAGKERKIQSDAEYVVSLPKVEERRLIMASLKRGSPELYLALEARVKKLFAERFKKIEAAA